MRPGLFLLLFACFCVFEVCWSHPNCIVPVNGQIFPPKPDPPLEYCAHYGLTTDGACCTVETEKTFAKNEVEKLIDFADPTIQACAEHVKKIFCTWCSPYAGHHYESENGAGHRQWPWLCTPYCGRFWADCATVNFNTSAFSPESKSLRIPGLASGMQSTSLSSLFTYASEYCSIYADNNPGSCYTDNPKEMENIPGGASIPMPVEPAYPNLDFNGPLLPLNNPAWYRHITHIAPIPRKAGDEKLISVSFQHGVILSFVDSKETNEFNVMLDVQQSTYFDNGGGSEYGVMGVAFHPNFANNGWMYVKHSHLADTDRIVRYTVNLQTMKADMASELVIMQYQLFGVMHHGAPPIFGKDGMMYIANGDGINYFDNGRDYNTARDPTSILGKILRINVDASTLETPYTIPTDNPFYGSIAWRNEIWAYGFRNPWRFTYDEQEDRFWTGVVGQTTFESVYVAERGKFHGWHRREGFNCYWPDTSSVENPFTDCATPGEVLPILEFPHDTGSCTIASIPAHCQYKAITGNAVIGGYVYRGSANPSIYGSYIFANYQPSFVADVYTLGYDPADPHNVKYVWKLDLKWNGAHDRNNWAISTLGLDSDGEILIANINNPNELIRFVPDGPNVPKPPGQVPVAGPNQPNSQPSGPAPTNTPTAKPPSGTNVVPSSSNHLTGSCLLALIACLAVWFF